MRQWRVGTLTLGSMLLIMGAGLLYAHINQLAVVKLIFTWWPVLFILLGAEVLVSQVVVRNNQAVLKYDFVAMFLLFLLVAGGMTLQAMNETGLSEQIKQEVASRSLSMNTETQEYTVEPGVKHIVIEAPSKITGLNVRTTAEPLIMASGKAWLNVDSETTAREMLKNCLKLNHRQAGDTLFISFDTLSSEGLGYNLYINSLALVLPEDVEVELSCGAADAVIVASDKSNWLINSDGEVNLDIPAASNLEVKARVNDGAGPGGNVAWKTDKSIDPEQETPDLDNGASFPVTAVYSVGNPQHFIDIEAFSLTANQR